MKLFLRLGEIAELFGCPEKAALSVLEQHGVKPVDYGSGRGRGKRWYAPAITQLAQEMHERAQEQKQDKAKAKKRSLSDAHPILGKSKSELKLLLTPQAAAMQ